MKIKIIDTPQPKIPVISIPIGQVFEARIYREDEPRILQRYGDSAITHVLVDVRDPRYYWDKPTFAVYDYTPLDGEMTLHKVPK